MSLVSLPVVANGVALLRTEGEGGGVVLGMLGVAAALAHVCALLWIGRRAVRVLRVESLLPTHDASHARWLLTKIAQRTVHAHWALRDGAQPTDIAFKRHAQAVLSQAVAWWYCPLEAALGVAVGIADGSGSCKQPGSGSNVAAGAGGGSAVVTAAWGIIWAQRITALLSGVAVLLAAGPSGGALSPVIPTVLMLAATGICLVSQGILVVSVLLWTLRTRWWVRIPSDRALYHRPNAITPRREHQATNRYRNKPELSTNDPFSVVSIRLPSEPSVEDEDDDL